MGFPENFCEKGDILFFLLFFSNKLRAILRMVVVTVAGDGGGGGESNEIVVKVTHISLQREDIGWCVVVSWKHKKPERLPTRVANVILFI